MTHPAGTDPLDQQLARLAEDMVFPETPAFNLPGGSPAAMRPIPLQRGWLVGLAAAVVLLLATLTFPGPRETVGNWFSFPGIRIEVGDRDDDPPATVTTVGNTLFLGATIALDDASDLAEFDVVGPSRDIVPGQPEAWLNDVRGTTVASLLYPATDALPSIGSTGVGLLLMQVDAGGDTWVMLTKRATGETPPQSVMVNGESGLWVQGGVLMTDTGDPFWTYQRRSGNVLIWEQDGITYRLECNLPLDDALVIAGSLEPVGD